MSNLERLLRDQSPKIARVPWLIQIAFFPRSLGHPGRVPNQGQDRQGTLPGGTLDLPLAFDCIINFEDKRKNPFSVSTIFN